MHNQKVNFKKENLRFKTKTKMGSSKHKQKNKFSQVYSI
jgi:hypothetical protein